VATTPLGAAAVVALATCTSVIVSLVTVWLWTRTIVAVTVSDAAPAAAAVANRLAEREPAPALSPQPGPSTLVMHPLAHLTPLARVVKAEIPYLTAPPSQTTPPSQSTPPRLAAPRRPAAPPRPAARPAPVRAVTPRATEARRSDFVVTSDPEGANVTINGIGYGPTPVTVHFLPPGARRIRVTKSGYRSQEQVVSASADSREGIRIVLAELPDSR
jgi:hypothetical protein